MARQSIPLHVKRDILTEAGYRCAVPTCRTILAIDLHHIEKISEGGGNTADNLIALCPTCHALHHREVIPLEAIRVWKGMLVSLNRAFDKEAIDYLLFLTVQERPHEFSSDGVLKFASLIAAGLVRVQRIPSPKGGIRVGSYAGMDYALEFTDRGRMVVEAWQSGDQAALTKALAEGAGPSISSTGGTLDVT